VNGALPVADDWLPIQVKQVDKVGRPDIDAFEAAMEREDQKRGFVVPFDFSRDAEQEWGGVSQANVEGGHSCSDENLTVIGVRCRP
jgi:hypothetical protein